MVCKIPFSFYNIIKILIVINSIIIITTVFLNNKTVKT